MAEVLFNVANSILNTLGALALQEIVLLRGLSDELEKLRGTVLTIKAVLLDAEKLSRTSNEVKLWLVDLKDAVYDADDLLDDISTETSRRQLQGGNVVIKEVQLFFSKSNRLAYGLKMAHKVKEIRLKLDGIAENRKKFHLNQNIVEQSFVDYGRDTYSSAPNVVVGREDDKKELMSLLLAKHEENVMVIPIVGLGGLGKTTLAQIVYNDETVNAHFDLRVWVCVSDIFDVKAIVEKMIECIDGGRPTSNHGIEALKIQLYEKVKGKKYLFVLDDIWNEDREEWIRLIDLIGGGDLGSRILVTTRNNVVAEITATSQTYELKVLSLQDSWDLFRKVSFKQGQPPNKEFEELGKEIVAKCGGIPLAIRTIGSLLYTRRKESEWQHFKDEEFAKLDPKDKILETLKLSYNYLPSHLKHCFAYCSIFPKDYIFDAFTLVEYWKAQGYVDSKSQSTSSSDDNGLSCLKYLVQRSFFQVEREDEDGEILQCRMHDFMHDLATFVAGEEAKLLIYGCDSATPVTGKTRHISLHEVWDDVKFQHLTPILPGKKARTLIVQSTMFNGIVGEDPLSILDQLRRLRVLVLSGGKFKKLPSFIDKLKHLRELDLSHNTEIEMLHESITRLYNLQVLNLDSCGALKKLPRDLKKLVNLTHLGVEGCTCLEEMPRGIGKLTSLEVMSKFVLFPEERRRRIAGGLDELQKLNKLRGTLVISNLGCTEKGARESCEAAKLKDKLHLRSLRLVWGSYCNREDASMEDKSLEALEPHVNLRELTFEDYGGARFPRWISALANLVDVHIIGCYNCTSLPSLDGLPSLQHLSIRGSGNLEYMIDDDNDNGNDGSVRSCFFPSLKTLDIEYCHQLKGWWKSTKEPIGYQLPCLYKLEIRKCPNLNGWMPQFPSLSYLLLEQTGAGLLEEILKQSKPPSLQSLFIMLVEGLTILQEDALRSLASLNVLDIHGIADTKLLSPWLHHLTSLENLEISYSHNMDVFEEDNAESIRSLANCLRFLVIHTCEKMNSLPKGIQHLASLETLEIYDCEKLESMPMWMSNLASLNTLKIHGSPKLSERCGSNRGADWSSISRIPNVQVDRVSVQRNGVYQL